MRFDRLEASGGLVLMTSAGIALIWANGPWAREYFALANLPLGFRLFGTGIEMPLLLWVNDGLMTVFFFVVGLEIKRELTVGELSNRRTAALPVAAALGGLAAPAAAFALINAGGPGARGWGIPIATDIAFSLAVLSLLGRRAPVELKVLLTALAIVDDIGALAVIALFYSQSIDTAALAWACLVLAALAGLNRFGAHRLWLYAMLGGVLWLLLLSSGIHATIAGVLVAFFIPATPTGASAAGSPLERAEHVLLPWSTYLVIPLFGLLNAGVAFGSVPLGSLREPIAMGIVVGLVVGKPLGILVASWIAVKTGFAELPSRVGWTQLAGAGCLAGIGFTMSIFIAELAFGDAQAIETAKLGVLLASVLAACLGSAVFALNRGRPEPEIA